MWVLFGHVGVADCISFLCYLYLVLTDPAMRTDRIQATVFRKGPYVGPPRIIKGCSTAPFLFCVPASKRQPVG